VAFAHGGGSFPATIGRIEQGYRVRPDLTALDNDINPRDYLGRFYVDSLIHDAPFLDFVIKLVGSNRVMIGSDYPFPLGEDIPGHILTALNLSTAEREQIQYGNALDWLGLDRGVLG